MNEEIIVGNNRFGIAQDAAYLHAVGLATMAFARLEWDAIRCCERLKPGYTSRIEQQRKTTSTIATDLYCLFSLVSDAEVRTKIVPFAAEFSIIVIERNRLLHANVELASNGHQRLVWGRDEWTIDKVDIFSQRCVAAGIPLNALLYEELSGPCHVTRAQA